MGIQFLRNFFVQLDYEQNEIMIGLNSNGLAADSGITYDPEGRDTREKAIPKYNYDTLVHLVIWSLVLSLIGLVIFVKKHKGRQQQEHVSNTIAA